MAMEDEIRSSCIMERIGCSIAFSTSMPFARASTRARSRSVTMSWSRSCGDSSRRKKKAITTTPMQTSPEMMNWSCQGVEVAQRVGGHQARGTGRPWSGRAPRSPWRRPAPSAARSRASAPASRRG